jgi:hypothetical protein
LNHEDQGGNKGASIVDVKLMQKETVIKRNATVKIKAKTQLEAESSCAYPEAESPKLKVTEFPHFGDHQESSLKFLRLGEFPIHIANRRRLQKEATQ